MAAAHSSSNIKITEYENPITLSLTVAGDANYLHVVVWSPSAPSAVSWNGSETMTLDNTQTTSSSWEARHYSLVNPTATTANVSVTVGGEFAIVFAVAASGVDEDTPVRGYDILQMLPGNTPPRSVSPAGNLTGDLLLMLWVEYIGAVSSIVANGGSTLTTNSPIESMGRDLAGFYKVATTDADSIGVSWTGSAEGGFVLFGVALAAAGGAASIAPQASYYRMMQGA